MKSTQRGAALLLAMIIVALISTLATAMVWQQWRAIQVETAERARAQSSWVLIGAGDWARLILSEQRASFDSLGQPWALPLQEARLSTFLAADKDNTDDAPDAFLSGAIVDAQSRYDLVNLTIPAKPQDIAIETARLDALLSSIGVAGGTAQRIATYMRATYPAAASVATGTGTSNGTTSGTTDSNTATSNASTATTTGTTGGTSSSGTTTSTAPTYLQPHTIDQLAWFGIDDDTIARMRPYVTILPTALNRSTYTGVNINTAPREVLAAVTGVNMNVAQQWVLKRQSAPFQNLVDDVKKVSALDTDTAAIVSSRLVIKSGYFEVRGRLRLGDKVLEERSLVSRNATTGNPTVTTILRRRESLRDLDN